MSRVNGLPHNGSSDDFLEKPAKSRVGTFGRNLPPSRHSMRKASARGKSLRGSGHLVQSVVNAPTVCAGHEDGAFGVFVLTQLVEWLHLETVKTYKCAKELMKKPEEQAYKSCIVRDSSIGIALFADAASLRSCSVEKTTSAVEAMVTTIR